MFAGDPAVSGGVAAECSLAVADAGTPDFGLSGPPQIATANRNGFEWKTNT